MTDRLQRYLIASDAAALGGMAAYGGVIEDASGQRREVQGQTPRTGLQEVTAALAVLKYLPADADAVLQVDAQLEELQSVLVITHPHVIATQIPRNSSYLHQRAHELARAALRAAPTISSAEHQQQRLAVYAVCSVKTQPIWAVAYEIAGESHTQFGQVPQQSTKALTLQLLHDAARAVVPASHHLILSQDAKSGHPACQAEKPTTIKRLRREVSRVIASIQPRA